MTSQCCTTCIALPSASVVLSASMGSDFCMDNLTLASSSMHALLAANACVPSQLLTFVLENVDFSYGLIDEGTSTTIFTSSIGIPVSVNTTFNGTQWELTSVDQLALDCKQTFSQDPVLAGLGVLLDVDPTKFYTLDLDVTNTDVANVDSAGPAALPLSGLGFEPTWNRDGWNPNVPSLQLTGPTYYADPATQYLYNGGSSQAGVSTLYDYASCVSGSYSEWTIFCVFQLNTTPDFEAFILEIGQSGMADVGCIDLWASNTEFACEVLSNGAADGYVLSLGTFDTNKHIAEFSADGNGNIIGFFDGVSVGSTFDSCPKTLGNFTIGGVWYPGSVAKQQMNGQVARVLMFSQNLNTVERTTVRNHLKTLYGTA